jgi:hypothetical protein
VNWCTLPAKDAEYQWEALGCWVHDVLGGWYEVTREQLPDCLALHRPALVQVSWLWTSHTEAYLPRSHPNQAAEWNTRWIDATLGKIKTAIPTSRCRAVAGRKGEHLVDELEAQQRRSQDPHQHARQQTTHPAYTPASPYSDPSYAHGPAQSGEIGSPGQQVIHRPFWQPYFEQAIQTDLTERQRSKIRSSVRQRQQLHGG